MTAPTSYRQFRMFLEHKGERREIGSVLDGWNPSADKATTTRCVAENIMDSIDKWDLETRERAEAVRISSLKYFDERAERERDISGGDRMKMKRIGQITLTYEALGAAIGLDADHKISAIVPQDAAAVAHGTLSVIVVGPKMPEVHEGCIPLNTTDFETLTKAG